MAFYKIKSGRVTGERGVLTYVGEVGHLFYSQDDNTIRISDGHTEGGIPLSGGSITFLTETAPPNPQPGQLWFDPVTGRLYVWFNNAWVDASPDIASTATGITLSMLTVGTGSATGGGALSYDHTTGVFTFQPADLSTYATQGYVTDAINNIIYPADNDPYTTTATVQSLISNSLTNFVYTGTITYNQISGIPADNDPYTTTATVTSLIANSLTNYATQVYVNSQGFITADIFTATNVSTFINDAHYLQVETGVHSVTGTANQVIVTDLGNRDIKLSTPQNLNSTATVTFGNLTVNNLNVLNTITNVTPAVVEGYRIYLASNSTQDTQIDGGGIVLGTSTWTTGLLYSLPENYWYTMDSAGFQTEHLIATKTTVSNLTVLTNADIGYSNLQGEFANALLQIDAASDTYSQVNFQNHSSSTWASGDFVVTNDIGTDGKHYIDMGINSSRYSTSSWVINGANDGYLYIDSGNLAIGTTATEIVTFVGPTDTTDSIISVANATTITYSVDLMPSIDAEYLLGRPGQRWKGIYVGTGSVWINDISLGTDAELTVDNGVLYVNGAFQLQVGQLKFFENTIESTTGATDIQIGQTTSTANLVLNRNVILATGKTFGLQDQLSPFTTSTLSVIGGILTVSNAAGLQAGQIKINNNVIESTSGNIDLQIGQTTSTANLVLNRNTVIATGKSLVFGTGGLQSVAWNSTATVLWNQITGVPGFATTATVTALIANSLTNYATQTYVNSQGFITSSALSPYTTTATVTALIANSLTNYATQTYVTTRGYITSSSLSVATGSAVSGGALAYSTTTGVFTFNPATAYTLSTATNSALGGVKIGTGINAAVDGTISVTPFSTSTLVATAVTANTVAGGYVSSITAGTGTQVSTSTGAVTIWALPAQAITSTGTTTASNYTLDLSGPTFVHWQPSANGSRTITLTGFTPGRKTEVFITPHSTTDVFTVSGVTASQCSNNKNTFTINGVGASAQTSFMLQIYCTTDTVGGVWIFGSSCV